MVTSVEIRKVRLNLIFEAVSTKPARDAVIVAIITIELVYQIEFHAHLAITPSSKNCRFFQASRYPLSEPNMSGFLFDRSASVLVGASSNQIIGTKLTTAKKIKKAFTKKAATGFS